MKPDEFPFLSPTGGTVMTPPKQHPTISLAELDDMLKTAPMQVYIRTAAAALEVQDIIQKRPIESVTVEPRLDESVPAGFAVFLQPSSDPFALPKVRIFDMTKA